MYKALKSGENYSDIHSTWIIAFCPDTNSFFVTNQRHFYWEYYDEFPCENDAIKYFRNHIKEFQNERKRILEETGGWSVTSELFLENTGESFKVI